MTPHMNSRFLGSHKVLIKYINNNMLSLETLKLIRKGQSQPLERLGHLNIYNTPTSSIICIEIEITYI